MLLAQLTESLKARPEELPERVAGDRGAAARRGARAERLRADTLRAEAAEPAGAARDVDGVAVLAVHAPTGLDAGGLRQLVLDARGDLGARPAVVLGAAEVDGKAALVAATNDAARAAGLSASDVLRAVLPQVDGRGGGKADVAQGGGPRAAGIADALSALDAAVRAGLGA